MMRLLSFLVVALLAGCSAPDATPDREPDADPDEAAPETTAASGAMRVWTSVDMEAWEVRVQFTNPTDHDLWLGYLGCSGPVDITVSSENGTAGPGFYGHRVHCDPEEAPPALPAGAHHWFNWTWDGLMYDWDDEVVQAPAGPYRLAVTTGWMPHPEAAIVLSHTRVDGIYRPAPHD